MKACGTACRRLLARGLPESHYFLRVTRQNRQHTAKFECFIWRSARTGKIFSLRSENYKSAESNSNSRITKSRTRFISAIPTAISWRLRRMRWNNGWYENSLFHQACHVRIRNSLPLLLLWEIAVLFSGYNIGHASALATTLVVQLLTFIAL